MKSAAEFWDAVRDEDNGCCVWTKSVDSRGYGNVQWDGKTTRAHRLAYILSYGLIPVGAGYHGTVVMHTCDNRLCCNPTHLRLGTHAENMADMKAKGRRKQINAGAHNGRTKLTPDQVRAIKDDTRGKRTIAKDYGVSPAQVQRIRNGLQWKAA